MDERYRLLLGLIRTGADVSALLASGLRYSQVTHMLVRSMDSGHVRLLDGILTLTQEGIAALELESDRPRRRDGAFIAPLVSNRVDRRPLDAVYLPKNRTSLSLGSSGQASPKVLRHRDGESPS